MARRPILRQADIARALKAAQSAGMKVERCEIDPATGRIILVSGEQMPRETTALEEWRARRGAR